jgi:hypothetical protein
MFWSLLMLSYKPVAVQLIMLGVRVVNVLIWLQSRQAVLQHSVPYGLFLSQKRPNWMHFFTNSKITDETGISTPEFLRQKPFLRQLHILHISITQKEQKPFFTPSTRFILHISITQKPLFTPSTCFILHISITQKEPAFRVYISPSQFIIVSEITNLNVLPGQKHKGN